MGLKHKLQFLISMPKSLVCNLILFPFKDAIKMPVFIAWNCKVKELHRGSIQFAPGVLRTGVFRFGFYGSTGVMPITYKGLLDLQKGGVLYLKGPVMFFRAPILRVGGRLTIDEGSTFNTMTYISCMNEISIGKNFFCAFGVRLQDTANHKIIIDGKVDEGKNTITIGDNVWFAAFAEMLKGTVADGSVVGYSSLVNKNFTQPNLLIAGVPARVIRENVTWED